MFLGILNPIHLGMAQVIPLHRNKYIALRPSHINDQKVQKALRTVDVSYKQLFVLLGLIVSAAKQLVLMLNYPNHCNGTLT